MRWAQGWDAQAGMSANVSILGCTVQLGMHPVLERQF